MGKKKKKIYGSESSLNYEFSGTEFHDPSFTSLISQICLLEVEFESKLTFFMEKCKFRLQNLHQTKVKFIVNIAVTVYYGSSERIFLYEIPFQ